MQLRPLFPVLGQALRNRSGAVAALTAALAGIATIGAGAPAAGGSVTIAATGLRSAKGSVLVCLTRVPAAFPECTNGNGRTARVSAAAPQVTFDNLAPGLWAAAILHDENGNGKPDKTFGIPREGFGFSRDAPVHMGPPKFAAAAFAVTSGAQTQRIKMRYLM